MKKSFYYFVFLIIILVFFSAAYGQYSLPNLGNTAYTSSTSNPFANTIYVGQCTWYVYGRILETGMITAQQLQTLNNRKGVTGIFLGDATTWLSDADSAGLLTGNKAEVGALAVWAGIGQNHVAFVESVNPDGSFLVTESNAKPKIGYDIVVGSNTVNGIKGSELMNDHSTNAGVIWNMPRFTVMNVIAGPFSQDGYTWYKLQGNGYTGWCKWMQGDLTAPADTNSYQWNYTRIQLSPTSHHFLSSNPTRFIYLNTSVESNDIVFQTNRDGNREIYSMKSGGTNLIRLTNNTYDEFSPSWSPDGNKTVFVSNRDGNNEIYIMNADGSQQTRLTNNSTSDSDPVVSPDGKKIVFRSDRDGNDEVYVMNIDGTNQINLTNNPNPHEGEPDWSPDGSKIAFSSWRSGDTRIWIMNSDGSNPTMVPNTISWVGEPKWSPDGKKIGYTGWGSLYSINIDGTNPIKIISGQSGSPAYYCSDWSPDGNKLIVYSNVSGNYNIYTINSDGTNLQNITNDSYDDEAPSWLSKITSKITITGQSIRGLAFNSGTIWALNSVPDVSDVVKITKINTNNGQVLVESNDMPWNGRGVTYGAGHLWITDALYDVVREIDPNNFAMIKSFPTPGSEPNGIAFDGKNLWLTDPYFQKIYQLDTTGNILSSFSIPNEFRNGLEWDNNGMWTNTDTNKISYYNTTGSITATRTLDFPTNGNSFYDIALGNGKVYVSSGENIYILNWSSNTPTNIRGSEYNTVPNDYALSQNYPNPFNPTTTINYSVPQTSFVTIKVYDVLGREITTLVNEEKKSGNYNVELNASKLASGIYFYRMHASTSSAQGKESEFVETKKLILMK